MADIFDFMAPGHRKCVFKHPDPEIHEKRGWNIKMFSLQGILPLVGVPTSALVAVVSTVQVIAGGIFALVGKIKEGISGSESDLYKRGVFHLEDGGKDLVFSIVNIATLGFSGFGLLLTYMESLERDGIPYEHRWYGIRLGKETIYY